MISLKRILPLLVSLYTLSESALCHAQSTNQPEFSVSTNYVAHGEHCYLIGKNLAPGSGVTVYDGVQKEPRFWFYADTNGNLHADITDPNQFDSAQKYHVAYITDLYFLVSYEDGNPYHWQSMITSITVSSPDSSTNRTVVLNVAVGPRHTYQAEYGLTPSGPWTPVGTVVPGYILTVSNITLTLSVPDDSPAKFFRIWNPQGY